MSEDGSAAIRQSMIQSDNAAKSQDGHDKGLNPLSLGNFSFDVLGQMTGNAQTAFVSPLAKLEGIMPAVESIGLLGVDLVAKLKESLAYVHGAGMPHDGDGYLGGSPMHAAMGDYADVMHSHGVSYDGHVENHVLGGLHPSQVAQIHHGHYADRGV